MTRDLSTWKTREPLVIRFEHALLGRHAERILGKPEEAERIANERDAAQRGIELGQLAELQLLDHLAREIARQRELHLAGHRLLIDRALTIHRVLFGNRADEDVLASLDQDTGLGLEFRRDQIDADEGQRRDRDRGAEHPPSLAHKRAADGAEIELAVPRVVHRHAALFTHRRLQQYATEASPRRHHKRLRLPSR